MWKWRLLACCEYIGILREYTNTLRITSYKQVTAAPIIALHLPSPLSPEHGARDRQIDLLYGTQSANASSKKKKTYHPLQQTGCKVKQDNLRHEQHDSCRCMSQTSEVGTVECNTELIHGLHQTCICARECQQDQNGRKMIRTWQPRPLKTPVLASKAHSQLE
jgi:hypothetical protein